MSVEGIFGNDLYTDHGRLRSDDLAVRNRVADLLARAAGTLRTAAVEYQRHHIPPPTRAQPFPDPILLEPARRAERLATEIAATAAAVRSAVFPDPQRVWFRVREPSGAAQLVAFDRALIADAEVVAKAAGAGPRTGPFGSQDLLGFDESTVRAAVHALRSILAERVTWLRSG
jgi:hypothetical protein